MDRQKDSFEYTVVKGDNATKIAKKHNLTLRQFQDMNPQKTGNWDLIHPGDKFRISIQVYNPDKNELKWDAAPPAKSFTPYRRIKFNDENENRPIAKGAQGKVYTAQCAVSPSGIVAIKSLLLEDKEKDKAALIQQLANLKAEAEEIMRLEWHPNVVQHFQAHYVTNPSRYLILMEYCPGGTLSSMVTKKENRSDTNIRKWTMDLLRGLEYLHKNNIIHRDIKGANILMTSLQPDLANCKIADLGLMSKLAGSFTRTEEASRQRGTPEWMSPEMYNPNPAYQVGRRTDIWSLGCTVIEMLQGSKPRFGKEGNELVSEQIVFYVGNGNPPVIPKEASPAVRLLLAKCFVVDPEERASATKLLQEDFLK